MISADPKKLRGILLKLIPWWMSPREGKDQMFRRLYVWALMFDATIQVALEAMIARFPGEGTVTALPLHAKNRQLLRGRQETADAFIQRLISWRTAHKRKGNPYEIARQVRHYCYPHKPRIRVVNSNGTWYTLNPDDTVERVKTLPSKNWDWDGNDALVGRIWVIIYPTPEMGWENTPDWGTGVAGWGEGDAGWGANIHSEIVDDIRQIIAGLPSEPMLGWKSATAVLVNVIVAFDDADFDPADANPPNPDGQWGQWSKIVGGVEVPARITNALYWRGAA